VRTSNRLRKTAGATAAVMAASSWVGLSGASRNADAIVPLSDEAMAQVSGGQEIDPIDYTCKAATIGTNVGRLGGIPISVPLAATTFCSAYWIETHIFEPYFYAPTFQAVYTGFLIMAGYQQNMIEVNGTFQCDPYNPNCATPTFYSSTVVDLDDYYCGYQDCWCDWDDDCYSYWCDGGYCVS
jgi:hypothetical protein